MEQYLLGIDLGTTALKAVAFDALGREIAAAAVEYSLLTPQTDVVEVEPEVYWDSLKTALSRMAGHCDLQKIVSISFSAQGETLLFLGADGKPLRNAIVWMDNRAKMEAGALAARFGNDTCYRVTGQVSFEPCWPASKVRWVRDNEPDVFRKTWKVALLEDYCIFRMTGKCVAEGSLLTSTTYWDIRTRDYWPEMLEELSLTRDMLPEILESGEPVGTLMPEIAAELGLWEGALVATGCLDQAAGALGVGNVREGMFSENIGAAMAICAITKELTYDPNGLMPVHYFALPGCYMMHTFTSGGMNLRWFRDAFCQAETWVAELTGGGSYDLLSGEAARVAPGCDGLLMLPHLSGSMAPDVNSNAKGVFYGFSLNHQKPHFVRAIMESLGYVLMRNIEALLAMGVPVGEVRSLGGGARSDVWNQIKCDVIGREIVTLRCKEAASLGAAILAGKAAGLFESVPEACERMVEIDRRYTPNPQNRDVYDQGYRKYKKLFRDLTELFLIE